MTDERVRWAMLNRANEAMHGVAAMLGKIDSNESLEGDECHVIASTILAALAESSEELLAWGIDVNRGKP